MAELQRHADNSRTNAVLSPSVNKHKTFIPPYLQPTRLDRLSSCEHNLNTSVEGKLKGIEEPETDPKTLYIGMLFDINNYFNLMFAS